MAPRACYTTPVCSAVCSSVLSQPETSATTLLCSCENELSELDLTLSSIKFKQPSLGTKAAIFFPFLISCTRAHFRMAELGCLASIPLRPPHTRSEKPCISVQKQTAATQCMQQIKKESCRQNTLLIVEACWTAALTSSPARFPLHAMRLRKASSTHCLGDSSCSLCLPIDFHVCACGACVQLPILVSFCDIS